MSDLRSHRDAQVTGGLTHGERPRAGPHTRARRGSAQTHISSMCEATGRVHRLQASLLLPPLSAAGAAPPAAASVRCLSPSGNEVHKSAATPQLHTTHF
ncbi:unnamed protein product [Lampetra planeri]